ncbi:CNX1 [Scenedesmus sp. PABB004]|nr:CNX1 [Scenedesmus sp. PABB004]
MAASRYAMISIPEATAIVLGETRVLDAERVPLGAALGRVLAAPVTAADALPPFPASIMDGYAVVAADGAGEFPVAGECRAGATDPAFTLTPGHVAYITTGAPVPPGADAVVKVEDTEPGAPAGDGQPRRVVIRAAAKPGQHIRPVGSDIEAGAEVLAAGVRVGVAEVGILATVGAAALSVRRRPRLAVLSTGDEVVAPDAPGPLGPGQIRDCNRAMLLAAAAAGGAEALDLGIARDAEGHLEGAVARALDAGVDVLVTSGAVSMGDRDLLKPLLEAQGKVHFGRVLMKPGKPLTFATLDAAGGRQLLVFGLPGNPVSSFVCFHLVVLPALRKMAGWRAPQLRRVQVATTSALRLDPERPEYHRVVLHYGRLPAACGAAPGALGWFAVTTGNQISSRLLSARSANALLELPRASGELPTGATVSALLIDDLAASPQEPGDVPATPGFEGHVTAASTFWRTLSRVICGQRPQRRLGVVLNNRTMPSRLGVGLLVACAAAAAAAAAAATPPEPGAARGLAKAALIVVDVQACFLPGGALPVGVDAGALVGRINALIVAGGFDIVIFTQDWHPRGHISFASTHDGKRPLDVVALEYVDGAGGEAELCAPAGGADAGLFPGHTAACGAGAGGAPRRAVRQVLWPEHCEAGTPGAALHPGLLVKPEHLLVRKGTQPHVDAYSPFHDAAAGPRTASGLARELRARGVGRVAVVGLATDFCVATTALDAAREGFDTSVVLDATAPVTAAGGADAVRRLRAAGVAVVPSVREALAAAGGRASAAAPAGGGRGSAGGTQRHVEAPVRD